MKNHCECMNCGWYGSEEDLELVEFDINDETETPTATELVGKPVQRIVAEPVERDFLKGCPICKTDSYLSDMTYKELWVKLGDVPVNEDEEIDDDFLDFNKGTDIYTIWHWFEETFNISVAKDLMYIN